MNRFLTLLLFPLLTFHAGRSVAAPTDPWKGFECVAPVGSADYDKLLSSIEDRYRAIEDMKSEFAQQSLFVGLDKRETSRGQLAFKRPGKMDWVYEEPERQRFVADGKTVWFFQPVLNQVTVDSFQDSFTSDLPITFLLGLGNLRDSFTVESACTTSDGTLLELEPKSEESGVQRFLLLVRETDRSPLGAKILDVGGNETAIYLSKSAYNSKLPDSQFQFDLPRGVDVIDQRANDKPRASASVTESELVAGKTDSSKGKK